MKDGDCYKLCAIKRNNFCIPTGGHSMLIHKSSNDHFSFFDPQVGCYSGIKQIEVADIIKLKAQLGEIAIMDNKKFLKSNHPDLLKKACNNAKDSKKETQNTLWNEFVKEMEQKMGKTTLSSKDTKIEMKIHDMQYNNNHGTKDEILKNIQEELHTINNTIESANKSDVETFINCFINFCKNNSRLEANDMLSNTKKDNNRTEEYTKHSKAINTAMKTLHFNQLNQDSPVKQYSEKLLDIMAQTLEEETKNKIKNVLTNQKYWFVKYLEKTNKIKDNNKSLRDSTNFTF